MVLPVISGLIVLVKTLALPPAMKKLEPGIPMTVGITVPVTKKLVVIVIGLMVPVGEEVVLLPKDSKLSAVLLPAAILGLGAWLIAHAAVLVQIGLMVPAEEEVVLLLKDSRLALVLLLTVILSLNACLTAHVLTLFPSLT